MKAIYLFCIIVLILNISVSAQESKPRLLSDTTLAIGITKNVSTLIREYPYKCDEENSFTIEKGTPLLICGVYDCDTANKNHNTEYFRVFYFKSWHWIHREDLATDTTYYDQIMAMNNTQKNNFNDFAFNYYDSFKNVQSIEKLAELKSYSSKGIVILKFRIYDESSYTDGTSFKIRFFNPTKKTIKYVWTTVAGINAVGDKVYEPRKGSTNITLKGIGPIESFEAAEYSYDYVWFTDIVDKVRLITIKVQYMDGTVKVIQPPSTVIAPEEYNDVYEDLTGNYF